MWYRFGVHTTSISVSPCIQTFNSIHLNIIPIITQEVRNPQGRSVMEIFIPYRTWPYLNVIQSSIWPDLSKKNVLSQTPHYHYWVLIVEDTVFSLIPMEKLIQQLTINTQITISIHYWCYTIDIFVDHGSSPLTSSSLEKSYVTGVFQSEGGVVSHTYPYLWHFIIDIFIDLWHDTYFHVSYIISILCYYLVSLKDINPPIYISFCFLITTFMCFVFSW